MSTYYLNNNRNVLDSYKQSLPDKIYLPLNMGRYIPPHKETVGRFMDQRPSHSIDLSEWIDKQLEEGNLHITTNDVVSSQVFTIGSQVFPVETSLTTLLTSIISYLSSSTADKHTTFPITTPSNIWTINHSLNKRPSVSITDILGNKIDADINYNPLDINQVIITFSTPTAGTVYLN